MTKHTVTYSSFKDGQPRRRGTRVYVTCSCGWQRQGNTRDDARLLAEAHRKGAK